MPPKRTDYDTYMRSAHWKRLRKIKFMPSKRCSVCTSKDQVHIHHLRYRNLYDVVPDDLRRMCAVCHRMAHKMMNNGTIELTEEMPNEVMFQLILVAVRTARGIVSQGYGKVIYPETKAWVDRYLDSLSPIPF